ncbi:MAG: hypothetical protein KKD39_01810, partial [Candidatus Altiarchaeota archaeon]|nr:hypothetical protein [Candidatus Altiarchaeota archaeon]
SRDLRGRVWPVFLWFSVSLIFLEFYPLHWSLPYMVSPRFFRYTHQFVPPASLLAGFFLSSIWAKLSKSSYRRYLETVFALSLLLYCLVSASNGLEISETYKSHYDDVRFASGYLMSLEPKRIYSDNNVADKYNFYTSYERMWQVPFEYNGLRMQYDVVSGNRIWLLYGLNDSYVVLGGSRGVDYGSNWILNQGHSVLPGNWTLIWGYDQELDSHRFEPLRIYYVK